VQAGKLDLPQGRGRMPVGLASLGIDPQILVARFALGLDPVISTGRDNLVIDRCGMETEN
jgi:hypothetical protein